MSRYEHLYFHFVEEMEEALKSFEDDYFYSSKEELNILENTIAMDALLLKAEGVEIDKKWTLIGTKEEFLRFNGYDMIKSQHVLEPIEFDLEAEGEDIPF